MHLVQKSFIFGINLIAGFQAAPLQTTTGSQQICSMPAIDLALVLDQSSSINRGEFEELRKFVATVISHIDTIGVNGTRLAAVMFAEGARTILNFTTNQTKTQIQKVYDSFERNPYLGSATEIGHAMEITLKKVFVGPTVSPRYMIVVTDGEDSIIHDIRKAVEQAKNQNVTVIAVGIGHDENFMETLKTIANGISKHVFTVDSFKDLKEIVPQICTAIENPCDKNPCRNFGVCVKLDEKRFKCDCIASFFGPCCQWDNPCAHDPCQNGTICVLAYGNQSKVDANGICANPEPVPYNCTCPPGQNCTCPTGQNCTFGGPITGGPLTSGASTLFTAPVASSTLAVLFCLVLAAAAFCFVTKFRNRYIRFPKEKENSIKATDIVYMKSYQDNIKLPKLEVDEEDTVEPNRFESPQMHKENEDETVALIRKNSDTEIEKSARILQKIQAEPDSPTEAKNDLPSESDGEEQGRTQNRNEEEPSTSCLNPNPNPNPNANPNANGEINFIEKSAPPLPPKFAKNHSNQSRSTLGYDAPPGCFAIDKQNTFTTGLGINNTPPKLPDKKLSNNLQKNFQKSTPSVGKAAGPTSVGKGSGPKPRHGKAAVPVLVGATAYDAKEQSILPKVFGTHLGPGIGCVDKN